MLELDPDDYYALNNAAIALNQMDQFERAEEYALRAIEIVPDLRFPYRQALGAQVSQGRFDAAQSTHDLLTSNLPGIPSIDNWGGQLAFAQGNHGLAHDLFVADLERRRGTPSVRAGRSFQLALVAAVQGHVDEAKLRHADAAAANDERGIPAADLIAAVSVARLELDLLGESAPAQMGGGAVTVAAADSVSLAFTAGAGSFAATGYVIYRSQLDDTATGALLYPLFEVSVAELAAGYDGGAAGIAFDNNRWLPNTEEALLLESTQDIYEFKQLAPLMKMPLAQLSPAQRFMVLLYGTPILYQPKKMVRFINIGTAV